MALSMLVALTTCPSLLATQEAVRQGQQKDRREAHRARRCNLIATCVKRTGWATTLNQRPIVLRDSKLVIDTATSEDEEDPKHLCTGYFLPYPDSNYEGHVTSISDDPPVMNWIYVDKHTYEVKYGVRVNAQPHITGPFDCTRQDRRMTLEGWEGFVAVRQDDSTWSLYFDRDDNGLKDKVPKGTRVLEVELWRVEKRRKRGEAPS
ncbi:uncharacterized protein HMPREF1541_02944 [Cyphellophora europaea CBS 101466]|uniref:Uncharacterized protein n=1 Tax=Cyphellophora europaea (strain CBS 101466) TaxID=1220924 RepID=W2RWY6_CYPE1|nr:uncharacterized protein HMPREF1541_02944 [Cyphellophora europaea CBS 101466]ETN41011.1 hypothetical protein HMPREF1541_02944 [Cyphellophora europaea CBS 101466]